LFVMAKLSLALLAQLLLLSTTTAQLAPHYTLTRVSPFPPSSVFGNVSLTDSGFLCGITNDPFETAFAWTVGGGGLPGASFTPPPPAGVAWTASRAVAINASGVFIGRFDTSALPYDLPRGFRFRGVVTLELFGPEGTAARPTALNDDGWIVGSTTTALGERAVLWSPELVASYLDPLEVAHDINDARQVLGSLAIATSPRGVLWQAGVVTELGDLDPVGQGAVFPAALNAHGEVVGRARIGNEQHAFRWTPSTGMRALPATFPAGNEARDVTDAGWVLGLAHAGASSPVPVLWSPTDELSTLAERITPFGQLPFALSLTSAFRLNASGQIAAMGNRHFQTAWVLLTPAELEAVPLAPAQAGATYVVDVTGARPARAVYLVGTGYDTEERGYFALPGGPLGLSMATPRLAARASADASGHARLSWSVPLSAAGQALRLQAFQLGPTRVSRLLYEQP